jgi:hypothetical protein
VHAHQAAQQVQRIAVGLAVQPQPADVVQDQYLRAVLIQRRAHVGHQLGQGLARVQRPVEVQDRLAHALRRCRDRGLHVDHRRPQIPGTRHRLRVDLIVELQPLILERRGDIAHGFGLALIPGTGHHHPGTGRWAVLERVALQPRPQQRRHRRAHRCLLKGQVRVRRTAVQVIQTTTTGAQRRVLPNGQPRRGHEPVPALPPGRPPRGGLPVGGRTGQHERHHVPGHRSSPPSAAGGSSEASSSRLR